MTISIRCDGCDATYNVPDAMVGKKAKCKQCGQVLTVAPSSQPTQLDNPAKLDARCDQCGARYSVDLAMAGKRAKCKKCGGVFEVPNPSTTELAEAEHDPLPNVGGAGLSDPLGDVMAAAVNTTPLPQTVARRPPTKKSSGKGVPVIVWIAVGGGGAALLLILLLVLLLFSGGDDDDTNGGGGVASTSSSGDHADVELPAFNDSVAWSWKADLPATPAADLVQKPLKLFDQPVATFFARGDVAQATISYQRKVGSKYDVLIQQLDLKTGQAIAEQPFAQYAKLLDLSQDGTSFLILPAENYARYETLQVWRWSGKAAKQVGEWSPYTDQSSKRIKWSMMVDANRVATGHGQEKVATIWDAKSKRVSRFPHEGSVQPRLSPGGKYLVQHSGIWLRFIEVATLKHAGSIGPLSSDYVNFSGVAYRPDSQAIAASFSHVGGNTLVVWKSADRQKQAEFELPVLSSPLAWIAEDYVLGGSYLVSVSNEMPVWSYEWLKPFPQSIDRRVWHHLSVGQEHYLATATVPSAEAQSHIDNYVAANVPILKAGDSVGLQVKVSGATPAADFEQKLTQTVTTHLRTVGYKIEDGSPFRLRVTLEDEDSGEKIEYRTLGSGGSDTISVPDKHIKCEVAFVDSSDTVVWRISTSVGPSYISFNRDANTDFATGVLNARWDRFNGWIQNIRIEPLVRKFSSIGEYGSSQLNADGERIVKVSGE